MKVQENDLEFIKTPKVVETRHVASVKGRDFHVSLELDLRGERYENALQRLRNILMMLYSRRILVYPSFMVRELER